MPFEQKKREQLLHIDERLARLQEERACIQAASNQDALKACRERFRGESRQKQPDIKQ